MKARQRGMTLLEVMVSIGILAMMSLLIYGAFDSLSRSKRAEGQRIDRARQGREATLRIARDLSAAFVSLHFPLNLALATRKTAFIGQNSSRADRLDFASFAHRRVERDAKESDQCEIGYFLSRDPDVSDKMDLVRREQTPIDMEPKSGGNNNVLAEEVEEFDVRYLDALTGMWTDSWDTTQGAGQPNRLPLAVQVKLVLKGVLGGPSATYQTKIMLPMQQPIAFGLSP